MCRGLVFPLSAQSRRKSRNRILNPNPNPSLSLSAKSLFCLPLSRAGFPLGLPPFSLSFSGRRPSQSRLSLLPSASFPFGPLARPTPLPPPAAPRSHAPRGRDPPCSLSPSPVSFSLSLRFDSCAQPRPAPQRRWSHVRRRRHPGSPLHCCPRAAPSAGVTPGPAARTRACRLGGERALCPSPRVPLPVLARGPHPFLPLSFSFSRPPPTSPGSCRSAASACQSPHRPRPPTASPPNHLCAPFKPVFPSLSAAPYRRRTPSVRRSPPPRRAEPLLLPFAVAAEDARRRLRAPPSPLPQPGAMPHRPRVVVPAIPGEPVPFCGNSSFSPISLLFSSA